MKTTNEKPVCDYWQQLYGGEFITAAASLRCFCNAATPKQCTRIVNAGDRCFDTGVEVKRGKRFVICAQCAESPPYIGPVDDDELRYIYGPAMCAGLET